MAYHFRGVKNTLRLFPSAKTIGFSTRANEGDSQPVNNVCCESFPAAVAESSTRLPHVSATDLSKDESACNTSRCQSDVPDLSRSFVPAVFFPAHQLSVACTDLASILRLSSPAGRAVSNKDLSPDLASAIKLVHPTTDDILAEPWQAPSSVDADLSHRCFPRSFSLDSLDRSQDRIPLEILDANHHLRRTFKTPAPSFNHFSNGTHLVDQTFFSTSQPSFDQHKNGSDATGIPDPPTPAGRPPGKDPGKTGPTPEQMQQIKDRLEKMVCKMFSGRMDYSVLHKNVVLENNLFGDNKITRGLLAYGVEMLKLRLRVHARFSNTSVELQSVTVLEQAGVVRIHWRLKGISQIQTLKFWRLLQSKTPISKDDYEWLDAFSYFHIGKDGLVHKHRIDRMIPDDASGKDKIAETLRELLTPAKPLVS